MFVVITLTFEESFSKEKVQDELLIKESNPTIALIKIVGLEEISFIHDVDPASNPSN